MLRSNSIQKVKASRKRISGVLALRSLRSLPLAGLASSSLTRSLYSLQWSHLGTIASTVVDLEDILMSISLGSAQLASWYITGFSIPIAVKTSTRVGTRQCSSSSLLMTTSLAFQQDRIQNSSRHLSGSIKRCQWQVSKAWAQATEVSATLSGQDITLVAVRGDSSRFALTTVWTSIVSEDDSKCSTTQALE